MATRSARLATSSNCANVFASCSPKTFICHLSRYEHGTSPELDHRGGYPPLNILTSIGVGSTLSPSIDRARSLTDSSLREERIEEGLEGLVRLSPVLGPEPEEDRSARTDLGLDEGCLTSNQLRVLSITTHQDLTRLGIAGDHMDARRIVLHLEDRAPRIEYRTTLRHPTSQGVGPIPLDLEESAGGVPPLLHGPILRRIQIPDRYAEILDRELEGGVE